jgi:hypothetical protein
MPRRTASSPSSTGTNITATGSGLRKLICPHAPQVRGQAATGAKAVPQKPQWS